MQKVVFVECLGIAKKKYSICPLIDYLNGSTIVTFKNKNKTFIGSK